MPEQRRPSIFLAALALVAVERTLLSLSRADEYQPIELYNGSLAWAILQGTPLDPEALPVIEHLRGSVVFALLLVPIFALLGPSLLGLRILAVGWSALTAGLFALALERHVGRRAAWTGAALFALVPPAFQIMDVQALGSHADSLLFVFAALALLPRRGGPTSARRTLGLGLVTGLGVLFSYQVAVALPALLAAWWAADRGLLKRRATWLFPLMFLVAVAPIPLLSRSATIVGRSASERFLPEGFGSALEKFGRAWTSDLPHSWLLDAFVDGWAMWFFFAAVAIGLPFALRRVAQVDPVACYAVLHPLCIVAAYSLSDFEMSTPTARIEHSVRYFLPLQTALLLWIVFAFQALAQNGRRPVAQLSLAALVLLPLGAGLGALLEPAVAFRQPPVRGNYFPGFRSHIEHAGGGDPGRAVEWAHRLDPDWHDLQPQAYNRIRVPAEGTERQGAERRRAGPRAAAGGLAALRSALDADDETRSFLLVAAGVQQSRRVDAECMQALGELLGDPRDREAFLLGVGKQRLYEAGVQGVLDGPIDFAAVDALGCLEPADAAIAARGAGFRLGRVYSPHSRLDQRLLEASAQLSPRLRTPFLIGLGQGYRARYREATYAVPAPLALAVERQLPPADRAPFRLGLHAP